jgi:hypothetical protein
MDTHPQNLAQCGDLYLQVVLLYDQVGPDQGEQFVLGDQLARALDQGQQHVERPVTERHRAAVHQQLALVRSQLKRAKAVCGGHGSARREDLPRIYPNVGRS